MVAAVDRSVHDLLWPDDDAHRRAGTDDRIAACLDSRTVPRQLGTDGYQVESPAGKPLAGRPVRRPSESVSPDPAGSVYPGTKASPVFPGGTATACSDPGQAEVPVPDAVQAGL